MHQDGVDLLTFSLDLGQAQDSSALSVLRLNNSGIIEIPALKRYPLNTSYVQVANDVTNLIQMRFASEPSQLVIDATGVGRSFYDMVKDDRKQKCIPILITGGEDTSFKAPFFHIPKKDLVTTLKIMLEQQRVALPEIIDPLTHTNYSEELKREVQSFDAKVTSSGNVVYSARSGAHDDLLLSVAMGVYWLAKRMREPRRNDNLSGSEIVEGDKFAWQD